MQARIAQVLIRDVGSTTSGDHLAGALTISVANASDFSDYGNDEIEIDGALYYTAERLDSETEEEDDALVLTTPLLADVESGTVVYLLPKQQVRVASAYIEDDEDDTHEVNIPFEMQALFEEGIRDPDEQESVEVEINEDGEYEIVGVAGQTAMINPSNLPPSDAVSDGVPPDASPATTLKPLYATLVARWPEQPNEDLVGYEIWMSAPDIAPTQVETTYGTSAQIISEPSGAALRKGVEYTVWVHAFDTDGRAPTGGQTGTAQIAALSRGDLQQQVLDEIEAATTTSTAAAQTANAAAQAAADADAAAAQAASDALAASQAAGAAQSTANAAQTDADAAQTAAGQAQTLAESKGRTIVQVSAPTGANADEKNLWIDISLDANGKPRNRPMRWNPASTAVNKWEPITDQATIDAAAAAAAAKSAADAAKTRADEAFTKATDAATAAGQAQTAANGKNRVWYLPQQPPAGGHVKNDVWFDTSLDPVTGAIKKLPHMWDGDSWEPQPFGNAAIGNLDAAKITAGYLDVANRIEAGSMGVDKLDVDVIVAGDVYGQNGYLGTLNADQIKSGAVDAVLAILGAIEVGANITINPAQGIVIELADGGNIIFPSDGSPAQITATVFAKSLVVEDNLSIRGSGSIQGDIALANGITKPTVLASISARYESKEVVAFGGATGVDIATGLIDYSTTQYLVGYNYLGRAGLRYVNKSDLSWGFDMTGDDDAWTKNFTLMGLAKIGTYIYVLGQDNSRPDAGSYFGSHYIYKINSANGSKLSEVKVTSSTGFSGIKPALVALPNNEIAMVWHPASLNIMLRRFGGDTFDVRDDITLVQTSARYDVLDVEFAEGNIWVASKGLASVLCFSAPAAYIGQSTSTVSRQVAREFPKAQNTQPKGLTFDPQANRFLHMSGNNTMYYYGRNAVAETIRASYAWWDAVGTTHLTEAGPEATFYRQPRQGINIETPEAPDVKNTDANNPDKADRIVLYAANNAAPREVAAWAKGTRSQTFYDSFPTSGALPQTTNQFAGAGVTPGVLKSTKTDAAGNVIRLSGDGSGRLGPFAWGSDGKGDINKGPERPGTIIQWSAPSIPLDCAVAQGQAVPRPKTSGYGGAAGNPNSTSDVYQALFSLYGTTYGAGDGSTTFNLPDYRDRVLVGIGSHATALTVNDGVAYGSRTLAHKHQHIMPDHTHYRGTLSTSSASSSGIQQSAGTAAGNVPRWDTFNNHTHTINGETGVVVGANPSKYTEGQPKTGTDAIPFHGIYVLIKL